MGEAAQALERTSALSSQGWGLRLAQQAFAALLEDHQRGASLRIAALRASARARLTALSVDDRQQLQRWLVLQLATGSASAASKHLDVLSTVDALISARVRAHLPGLLASSARSLPNIGKSDSGDRISKGGRQPLRHVVAGGLPLAGRPSMLSTLFR